VKYILGEYWRHNYLAKINYLDIPGNIQANAVRSNGQTVSFILNNSVYTPDADMTHTIDYLF
jgi:hypothetical protein